MGHSTVLSLSEGAAIGLESFMRPVNVQYLFWSITIPEEEMEEADLKGLQ
jgi:hypothetical protein